MPSWNTEYMHTFNQPSATDFWNLIPERIASRVRSSPFLLPQDVALNKKKKNKHCNIKHVSTYSTPP
jgi:hypothetical protein